jgi:hypothetical protein
MSGRVFAIGAVTARQRAGQRIFSKDLQRVIDAWPNLPLATRQAILNLVDRVK